VVVEVGEQVDPVDQVVEVRVLQLWVQEQLIKVILLQDQIQVAQALEQDLQDQVVEVRVL
jgi:hypothetical protein|tara:strand:- start:340 stop:519 length:180 start_codon:yes stop_codon:yes gene_type:complete